MPQIHFQPPFQKQKPTAPSIALHRSIDVTHTRQRSARHSADTCRLDEMLCLILIVDDLQPKHIRSNDEHSKLTSEFDMTYTLKDGTRILQMHDPSAPHVS